MNKNKVLLDVNEGVAIITINNPDSRNALSEDVRSDFDLAIKKVELEAGKTIPVSYTHLTLPTIYSV